MPPTKSKGTRYQPKGLYLAATVCLAIAAFYSVSEQFAEEWLNQLASTFTAKSTIQWRDQDKAISESKSSKKPILYAFLAGHNTASMQMLGDGFSDGQIAELINSRFIPVRVDYSRDENISSKSPNRKLHNQYGYVSSCELLVVPSHMTDLSTNDVMSTANLSEAEIDDTKHLEDGQRYQYNYARVRRHPYDSDQGMGLGGSAKFTGYTNKRDLLSFLYTAQHWHQLPPSKGKVNWLPLAQANAPLTHRPRLLAFVDNAGYSSDSMRLDTFWNRKDYTLINSNFDSVLVEFHHDDPAYNAPLEAMKAKYGITSLPALVIEGQNLPGPLIQYGQSNINSTHEFLEAAVRKNAIKR